MTNKQPDFANKYRPQDFGDFKGQDHPVRYLSGLIQRGQIGRNLLLHGTVGSGKTSLVRLYAKALNCEAPTSNGSPCDRCRWCKLDNREQAGLFEYDVPKHNDETVSLSEWLIDRNRSPEKHEPRYRVIFFDEAHALKKGDAEALLKIVEEPVEGVIFCFATTEFSKIQPALRSRLFHLQVRPLPAPQAIQFLKDFAEKERVEYEPEALALLAGLKQGYPRDLLTGLEQVVDPDGGCLTLERVRTVFDVDHTKILIEYFLALADGDFARETAVMAAWRDPPAERVRWVQAFLTALYYNNVLGNAVIVDALMRSISDTERAPILERFCTRLGLANCEQLRPVWLKMMAFWPVTSTDSDDAAVMLRIVLFHELVNDALPRVARGEGELLSDVGRSGKPAPTAIAISSRGFQGLADSAITGPHGDQHLGGEAAFLRLTDVRTIINAASFLTQEHGVLFNVAFRVRPALFGVEDENSAMALIAEFQASLRDRIPTSSDGPFAAITLLERDGREVVGRILAHVPRGVKGRSADADPLGQIEAWHRVWRSETRIGGDDAAVSLTAASAGKKGSLTFHWRETLNLCAGLDEGIECWDPDMLCRRPVLELLGLPPNRWRQPGPLGVPLVNVTDLLQPEAIAQASRNGMAPLSAFDAQAWTWLRKGWERDEHFERIELRERRDLELEEIAETYGAESAEVRAAISERERLWGVAPERRARNWQGWWLSGEA